MANETVVTIIGNLTADVELRYTQSGLAVANFTIASTPRIFDRTSNEWKDGDTLFLRSSAWRDFAENIAGEYTKGSHVIAQGVLKQRSYETKEGEKRTSIELEVSEMGRATLKKAKQGNWAEEPAAVAATPASDGGAPNWNSEVPF